MLNKNTNSEVKAKIDKIIKANARIIFLDMFYSFLRINEKKIGFTLFFYTLFISFVSRLVNVNFKIFKILRVINRESSYETFVFHVSYSNYII